VRVDWAIFQAGMVAMTEIQEQDVLVLGHPEDCTGLRQFLVEREICAFGGNAIKRPTLIWVSQNITIESCGHAGYVMDAVSVEDAIRNGMKPEPVGHRGPVVVCGKMGRFIE